MTDWNLLWSMYFSLTSFVFAMLSLFCLFSKREQARWTGRLLMFVSCLVGTAYALLNRTWFGLGFELSLAIYFGYRTYATILPDAEV